ncbi:SDR family oxidoreductase [Epilithonimonas caeni]|uniref:SDR family oxidoreductase n=1 Tax=Epilithonimonas caeni TaxID=365343 RepID=UPI00041DB75B|nr:aldehyde reductase [Epilithonimonas caeni]
MTNKETVLVTGGSGFLGMRIIVQLLQKGYNVRTTVRSLKSIERIGNALKSNRIPSENLSFFEAELTNDANWEDAMKGSKYVLSVASPVFFDRPKDEEEALHPAREGVLRILRFARKADVKRVVMTSNFGAVGFTQTDKRRATTEEDWTNTGNTAVSVYERSKTLAEMAAWEFIKSEGGDLEFTTINPVAILGPSLDEHVSGSFHLLQDLINGSMKAVPNISLNIVDVRDVADLHIRAMEINEANGHRFIATSDGQISLPEIAQLIKTKRPEIARKITSRKLPDFILQIAALFNEKAKEGVLLSKMNRNVSNRKAKTILHWEPVASKEDSILAAVDTLIKYNLIK